MPTYNQGAFILRAIDSVIGQSYKYWELIIVNDGSTDGTSDLVRPYLTNCRIKYVENDENLGFCASINKGINEAEGDYIAYLPSDDFYYPDHLLELSKILADTSIVLAYSGIRYDEENSVYTLNYKNCEGAIPGNPLQLVQVAHKKTEDRWIERYECVSPDLFYLFWRKLSGRGVFQGTGKITCEWTNHPYQHHKICSEKLGGGLNIYRKYYNVNSPIVFRASRYKTIDENLYGKYYENDVCKLKKQTGLKILLVGELAYHAERVYELERDGHILYGLWSNPRYGYSTIGPLPFGNVINLSQDNWKEEIREIQPDIIYALLSTGAIELSHEVMEWNTDIPFVWHFKEGPHEAMKAGLWSKLIELYSHSDGNIFINKENKLWIDQFIPNQDKPFLLMDGDMPLVDSFKDNFSEKLSSIDSDLHTVVAGRLVGLSVDDYSVLAQNNIHIHVYSENTTEDDMFAPYLVVDNRYFHIHPHCPQEKWTEEFSKYDAGWLHCVEANNNGYIQRMTWGDMNLPARISTYFVAGIPMIQKRNANQLYAQRSYLKELGVDIPFDNIDELIMQLKNQEELKKVEYNVRQHRKDFCFTNNMPKLLKFFYEVIQSK